ncbi:MAG: CcmD family protein [Candidatus Latescibacterota bacterium]|nr:MAG: CcmD family protein [Candidatus Latescibacterota bacterium]
MGWLFAAFALVWFAVFVYLFDLGKKQRAMTKEIEDLKTRLAREAKG